MKICFTLFVTVSVVKLSESVKLHLNDSEFKRMPALFALDHYDGCLVQGGTYCLVTVDLEQGPDYQLMETIQKYSELKSKHFNNTHIERGVCVTKTCRKYVEADEFGDIKTVLTKCLNETMLQEYGLQARVSHVHSCDRHDNHSKIDALDWIVAALFLLILVVNIAGTCYDIIVQRVDKKKRSQKWNNFLLSFSVFENWKWLMGGADFSNPRSQEISAVHGAKSISIFFILFGHVGLFLSGRFIDNPHDFEKIYDAGIYYSIINGAQIVQIFFALSGYLLIHNLLTYAETKKISWSLMPKMILYRWCRLTPANAAILAFTATWLRHLGSGPLWKLDVTRAVTDCRRYWSHHLLYINNYVPEDKFCGIHKWHVAAQLQLFCVGVAVYIAALSRGRLWPLVVLLLLGIVTPPLHEWLQDLDPGYVTPEMQRYLMRDSDYLRMTLMGHNNLSSYIIGICTGYFVYYLKKSDISLTKYKVLSYLSWTIIPIFVTFFSVGKIFYSDKESSSMTMKLLYSAMSRPICGLIVGFGIMSTMLRPTDSFSRMMNWSGWELPSKLSYCVYLNHMIVIHYIAGTKSQLGRYDFFHVLITHLGVYVVSYAVALPLCLLVEAPFNRLIKSFKSNTLNTVEKKLQ